MRHRWTAVSTMATAIKWQTEDMSLRWPNAKPKLQRYGPTTNKKAAFQNSMLYEIVYAFGVPQHDPHDYCLWEMINFTRMAHVRILYAFLETAVQCPFKDDVLAVDFGYPPQTITLPADARERLNKDLFHFSYKRLRHDAESKKWPNSIIGSLLEPVLEFYVLCRGQAAGFIRERRREARVGSRDRVPGVRSGANYPALPRSRRG